MKKIFNILLKSIGSIIILLSLIDFASGDILIATIVGILGILIIKYSNKFSSKSDNKEQKLSPKRNEKQNKEYLNDHKSKTVSIYDSIGDFIEIKEIGFFGQYEISSNKKYIIGYRDRHYENNKYIKGEIVLVKNNNILIHKKMPRPNDAKVANNGNIIVNDWGNSDKLSGTFYAYNELGNLIIKKSFKANLYNNGLSTNGTFAVCQTANSPNEKYSGKLFLFDIRKGKLVNSFVPKTGWANNYSFDIQNQELILDYKDEGSYIYNFDGELLDNEKWENSIKRSKNSYTVFYNLEEKYKQLSENINDEKINKFLKRFKSLLETEVSNSNNVYSKLHRYIGELYLKAGNKQEALNFFEKALDINENVGVKRITKNLKKNYS